VIRPVTLADLDADTRARLGNRAVGLRDDATAPTRAVVDAVRRDGDAAITAFLRRIDGVELEPERFVVEPAVADRAVATLPVALAAAMRRTVRNLEAFHTAQRPQPFTIEVEPGVLIGERLVPVAAAGGYVPFGKAIYPSSALMVTVPARVAGVARIVLASGVDPATGEIPTATLAAGRLGGATEIWRVSGPAAIAAFAYGTKRLARVDVIAGPGGPYVEAAKRLVRGAVGVDLDAGPSETLVLALDDADPALAAADLISEAEHGEDSCGVVLTTSAATADATAHALERQLQSLPNARRAGILSQLAEGRSGIVICADRDDAIAFAETIAAEHVVVHAADAAAVAARLTRAGTVCVGAFSPSPAGSYVAGTNHVLPTGGSARYASGLSTTHFLRRQSFEQFTRDGLASLRDAIAAYAEVEGLPGHLAAVDARLGGL
jgi:histidinol dehydrogenase